jgi:hypothetical protein
VPRDLNVRRRQRNRWASGVASQHPSALESRSYTEAKPATDQRRAARKEGRHGLYRAREGTLRIHWFLASAARATAFLLAGAQVSFSEGGSAAVTVRLSGAGLRTLERKSSIPIAAEAVFYPTPFYKPKDCRSKQARTSRSRAEPDGARPTGRASRQVASSV